MADDLLLRPGDLDDDQRALYDEIRTGPRADARRPAGPVDAEGRLTGPFNAMLHAPAVGRPLQRLGAALRNEASLSDDVRESVICLVGGAHRSSYELFAHSGLARRAGVPDEALEALVRGDLPSGAGPAVRLAHALLTGAQPTGSPIDDLGASQVFEVSTLVGYYTTLAWQLRLFGVEAPEAQDG